MMYKTMKFIH